MSSTFSAPPPGFNFSYQQQYFNPPNGNSAFSPAAIAIIGLLGAAFLIVSYHTALAKFWSGSRQAFRRPAGSGEPGDQHDAATAMLTRGLEESVIRAIPVYKYAKDDGLVDGSECSVCLGEFQNDESLRLLPKCSHAFHLTCIDQWLQSHSNCPLCRANIVSTAVPGQADLPASRPVVVTDADNHGNAAQGGQVMNEAGSSDYPGSHSDLRCSEPMADNPNDRRITLISESEVTLSEGGPGAVDVPARLSAPYFDENEKIRSTSGRHGIHERTSSVDCESFSTDRAFNFGLDEKMPSNSTRRDGDAERIVQRSCSMDSIYNRPDVRLEQCKQTIVYDLIPANRDPQLHPQQTPDGNASPSRTNIVGVGQLVVDMNTTGSTSSHSSATDAVSTTSCLYETNVKSKTDQISGTQLEPRLVIIKAGPFTVKRSISGGRLFGFRSKSNAGIVNRGLPI